MHVWQTPLEMAAELVVGQTRATFQQPQKVPDKNNISTAAESSRKKATTTVSGVDLWKKEGALAGVSNVKDFKGGEKKKLP